MEKEKIWTKDFIVIAIINFIVTTIFYLLMVTIGQYAMTNYQVSVSVAGIVTGIFIIGSIGGRIISTQIMLTFGSRRTMFIGLIFLCITTAAYLLPMSLWVLIVNRALQGLACGIAGTAVGTLVAQTLPQSRKGEGIGYYSLGAIIATAIGPFLGIVLSQLSKDFTLIFIVNVVLAFLCLVVGALLTKQDKPQAVTKKGFTVTDYIEVTILPLAIIALLAGFSYSGVMSFLSMYTIEIGLIQAGSYFFLIYAVTIIVTRPFSGKIFDRKGPNNIIYPSLVIFAAGMFVFSTAQTAGMLLLAALLIGLGFGNFNSVAQALAIKQVSYERLGLATSTYFIFFDFGLGFGPYFLGLLERQIGYRGVFLAMVGVIILCLVLYHILYGYKKMTKEVNA
ncbi:MAG: MFS transporter [Lysinibacillus sp.]